MLSQDLIKRVRQIEIKTKKVVNDLMTGNYKSQFKGHGMQFAEHRVYSPGDDIRHLDWKVSARTREPLIKTYEEERELSVWIVVDISQSQSFGTRSKSKSDLAAEAACMLAYAAIHSGDKVGAVLFAGEIEKIIPARKGKNHVLRLVKEILEHKPKTQGTSIAVACDSVRALLKHTGVVFLISDFIDQKFESGLKKLSRKNDVIALHTRDQGEVQFIQSGMVQIFDCESKTCQWVQTDSYRFREWLQDESKKTLDSLKSVFKRTKVDHLEIKTDSDLGNVLVNYFQKRGKK